MMKEHRPLDGVIMAIRRARRIALLSHVSPDGDTIGSALALRQGLLQLNREVELFCQDRVPEYLHFLDGAVCYRRMADLMADERFDLLLCVDVSDASRMGECAALMDRAAHTAQIDHHDTNEGFCEENCIDPTAPACALVAYELLRRLHCQITQEIAICLAVALSTDTGHLVYNSTTPEAFRVMGELVEAGAPISKVYRRLYRERPPRQLALLARALNKLTYHHGGLITSIALTQQDFDECGALGEDAEIIANYGMDIRGARMCVFARESGAGGVKLSLRSIHPWQVSGVATRFGGGGHAQAAGATVNLPLDEAVRQVVAAMKEELEKDE